MNDEEIIRQRISGRGVRAIAKAWRTTVAEINEAIDRWAASAVEDKIRKRTLSPLSTLDSMSFRRCSTRALEGDIQCGLFVTKIIERRCVTQGLSTPQTAVLQIVGEATPKETSTDRIERVLAELAAQDKKSDPATP